ncbi:MAG: extracellular solute-binding protein [Ruminococcus sp.]|nr:extracellular solute-binding protein [Ruminococcus sp.]MDE6783847.1 extracellular solute-binding protein [Ruminococcus sp.]
MNKLGIFKKTLAAILAGAAVLASVSCGEKGGEKVGDESSSSNSSGGGNNSAATPQSADKVMDKSYQAVDIGQAPPLKYVNEIKTMGDTGKVIMYGSTQDGNEIYITDMNFEEYKKVELKLPEADNIESYYRVVVAKDGTAYVFANITNYGDFELPDYEDPDFDWENFDYEAMEEAAERSYKIYTISPDGEASDGIDITGLEKYEDDDTYFGEVLITGNTLLLTIGTNSGQKFVVINNDGSIGDEVDCGDDYFYPSGMDSDGNLAYISYSGSDTVLKKIDAETLSLSPDEIKIEEAEMNYRAIFAGSGDYTVYLSGTSSLYGIKKDGTTDEIINWIDSDLNGDYIESLIPAGNDEFIVYENNWNSNTTKFYRLTKRDASEMENTQIISMMVQYANQDVMDKVSQFNKTNSGYRIKVEDYQKYYEWDDESLISKNNPEKQLKQDIASGKKFDIICMNNSSLIMNLGKKGALVDLYEYIDKDDSLSKEDFMPAVLNAGEIDGKLVSISSSFSLDTYALKSKYFDKENWTVDDIIETYNNLPDGMKLLSYGSSKRSVYGLFAYGGGTEYIDYDKGTCSFDSPEFIKILEFCNRFDNDGEGDEIDWETATNDEMDKYYNEQEVACRNDKALLRSVYLGDLRSYARAVAGDFGDDITLVGYPSANGAGGAVASMGMSYSIMSDSPNKDACWDFINDFFEEEYQTSEDMYNIPAIKSAFEVKLDEAMEKPYYMNSEGKKETYDDTYYIGGEEIKVPPLTKEQRDKLENYILSGNKSSYHYNDEVSTIIEEQLNAFFAGEKTAQETAELIQNRVSILVSEQS